MRILPLLPALVLTGCISAPSAEERAVPLEGSIDFRFDVGSWVLSKCDYPGLGDVTIRKLLISRTEEGQEWWEISITNEDKETQTFSVLLSRKPNKKEPLIFSGENGSIGIPVKPNREMNMILRSEVNNLFRKKMDLKNLTNMKARGNEHGGFTKIVWEDLEINGKSIKSLRMDMQGGMGPGGLKSSSWFSPEIPGGTAKIKGKIYFSLIPVGSMTYEVTGYGFSQKSVPQILLPPGTWPAKEDDFPARKYNKWRQAYIDQLEKEKTEN